MSLNFKNGICIAIIFFSCQLHADKYTQGSTFAFADLLIWKLREGGADNWTQEISPAGTNQDINVLSVPFKWDTGARLGIGHQYSYWDTIVAFTWFQTRANSQASVSAGGLYSPFLGNFYVNNTIGTGFGPNYRSANVQWTVYFDVIDLELGHSFKIDESLILRPFVGLKGGFINQSIDTYWQDPTVATNFTSATENLKNDFWGVGPSLGIDSAWPVYKFNLGVFNIFGNFSGALMWGHWSFKDLYQNNQPRSVTVNLDDINGAATMARALLGVEWIMNQRHSNLTLRLGYEAQVWFDQVQFYSLNMGRLGNIMSLQGGVLGFCFYF